jgi:hypothetical protein
MAYAGVAGLPLVVGLLAIPPALALYALFGTSRPLSFGPESTTGPDNGHGGRPARPATIPSTATRWRPPAHGCADGQLGVLPQLWSFLTHLSHVRPATVALSATTHVFLMAVVDEQTEPVAGSS